MKALSILRKFNPSLVDRVFQISNNTVTSDAVFMDSYWKLVEDARALLTLREAYNIYYHLVATSRLRGAVAELGVYKGGGAKLISQFKAERRLFLFDTFGGMPETDASVDKHRKGDFSDTSLEDVQSHLRGCSDVVFCQGFFPDTTRDVPDDTQFSFVHLDVDIYESTLAGLRYFYPRLEKGGVIISHDYHSLSCPGVKRAFDDFFGDSKDVVIPLWDTQCMVKKAQ